MVIKTGVMGLCKKSLLLIILSGIILLIYRNSSAQSLPDRIAAAAANFDKDSQLQYSTWSLCVLNAKTGSLIFEKNKDIGLATASCLKTVTAATAFSLLGKDFQYKTLLQYSGSIRQGVLTGDLIIHGSGDPTLGTWRYDSTKDNIVLSEWIRAVKKAGIKKIKGRIIGDDGAFDSQSLPDGWIWQDIGNYYGAGTSALTWRENQFDIFLAPGDATGAAAKIVRISPSMKGIQFVNELTTGQAGSGDQGNVYLPSYRPIAYLRGSVPLDAGKSFSISGAVPDAALNCADRLRDTLGKAGIEVNKPSTTSRLLKMEGRPLPVVTATIFTTLSPTLDKIIYWFLKRSINLYGEQLLKTLCLQQHIPVSTANGVEIVKRYWSAKGIDTLALNIFDGSGLSPANRVTGYTLAKVLQMIQNEGWFPAYKNALPVINGMTMKSGHINGVCSYAGYSTAPDGTPVVFAFLVNNYNGRTAGIEQKMFRVLDILKP